MKTKIDFFAVIMILFVFTTNAQKPFFPKPGLNGQNPAGQKLPPPAFNSRVDRLKNLPYNYFDTATRPITDPISMYRNAFSSPPSFKNKNSIAPTNKPVASSNFHLTKDINLATRDANAANNKYGFVKQSFAVLNDVSYFTAKDDINGYELWRSDGTEAGTYMVKDINPGGGSSNISEITAIDGLLYFSAYTDEDGQEPWISDGTEAGTKLLLDINSGPSSSHPNQFVKLNNKVIFTTENDYVVGELWKTDGTSAGTKLIYNFNGNDFAYAGYVLQAVKANGLIFFTAWNPVYGRELWRSDGTKAGTFLVKDIGPDQSDYYAPMQLTRYNNGIYFSGDDGSGRKLWSSDGTEAGTFPVLNNNNVFVQTDYVNYVNNIPFPVLGNVLYLAGHTDADGGGLYKYDAAGGTGIELVKDLTPIPDIDFIVGPELIRSGNSLYFKVISSNGDELWKSGGKPGNTHVVKQFAPGEITTNYYNINNQFFFVEDDPVHGPEPWTSDGTEQGTRLVQDIYPGSQGSYPFFFTPLKGEVIFAAASDEVGSELWISDGTSSGTTLVKDINAATTQGSNVGFFYKSIGTLGKDVVFNAFTPQLGGELYKSDGTNAGTVLLNDIAKGKEWSFPNAFLYKNNVDYFIGDDSIGTALYKTDGTSAGLKRIIPYINRDIYYVVNFNITDNG